MENQTDYQYSDNEDEIRNIRNYIKICKFCDNIKIGINLTFYQRGLNELKICTYCRNEIACLKNTFLLSRISKLYNIKKRKEMKMIIFKILKPLNIGTKSGIHQHIFDFVL